MTVKIDRYKEKVRNGKGRIIDLLHNEEIVTVSTRNHYLTKNLIDIAMEELNNGIETNDNKRMR